MNEGIEKMRLRDLLNPPERCESVNYLIKVSSPADNSKDFAAVMSSKEYLRYWSDSGWPNDGFTLEENLLDLQSHYAEHLQGKAFGYNIHSLNEDQCFGSVYLNDVDFILENYFGSEDAKKDLKNYDAVVSFWTSDGLRAAGHHQEILSRLLGWLDESWPFGNVLFLLRKNIETDQAVFKDCGLVEFVSLSNGKGQVIHLFRYEPGRG